MLADLRRDLRHVGEFAILTRQHISGPLSILLSKLANVSQVPSQIRQHVSRPLSFFSKIANTSQVPYLSNSPTCLASPPTRLTSPPTCLTSPVLKTEHILVFKTHLELIGSSGTKTNNLHSQCLMRLWNKKISP